MNVERPGCERRCQGGLGRGRWDVHEADGIRSKEDALRRVRRLAERAIRHDRRNRVGERAEGRPTVGSCASHHQVAGQGVDADPKPLLKIRLLWLRLEHPVCRCEQREGDTRHSQRDQRG